MGPERRQSRRLATAIPARWLRRGGAVEMVAADLSIEGLFLRMGVDVHRDQLLKVALAPSAEPSFTLLVVVRHMSGPLDQRGFGVEIQGLAPDSGARWLDFCKRLRRAAAESAPTG